jgi:hypothetical protein
VSESSVQVGSVEGRFGDAEGADACSGLGLSGLASVTMSSAPVIEMCASCSLFCRPSQSLVFVGGCLGSLFVSVPLINFSALSIVGTSLQLFYQTTKRNFRDQIT